MVIGFEAVAQSAREAEHAEGQFGRRVVRVFCDGPAPEQWCGVFGNAPIEAGQAGYQLSDGEIVSI